MSSSSADTWIPYLSFDDSAAVIICRLIASKSDLIPSPDNLSLCRDRTIDVTARQDSINWIFKVYAHQLTGSLAHRLNWIVNYFDSFLSTRSLPLQQQHGRWPFQQLWVACLSLATKMEEPNISFIVDLQIFEPKFVFEPKTVHKMELWVMSILNWRLRSVTPFDFLFISYQGFDSLIYFPVRYQIAQLMQCKPLSEQEVVHIIIDPLKLKLVAAPFVLGLLGMRIGASRLDNLLLWEVSKQLHNFLFFPVMECLLATARSGFANKLAQQGNGHLRLVKAFHFWEGFQSDLRRDIIRLYRSHIYNNFENNQVLFHKCTLVCMQ